MQVRLYPSALKAIRKSIKGTFITPTQEANVAILSYYAKNGGRRKRSKL